MMQIDRELTETDGTQTVMASVHFDVVFTRSSVFADVSFGFCTGKLQFFQGFLFFVSVRCLAVLILGRPGLQVSVWIFASVDVNVVEVLNI